MMRVLAVAKSIITKGVNVMNQGIENFFNVGPHPNQRTPVTKKETERHNKPIEAPELWEVRIAPDQKRLLIQKISA